MRKRFYIEEIILIYIRGKTKAPTLTQSVWKIDALGTSCELEVSASRRASSRLELNTFLTRTRAVFEKLTAHSVDFKTLMGIIFGIFMQPLFTFKSLSSLNCFDLNEWSRSTLV